ncbi:hypothetical protein KAJ27_10630 [bacterium]|nr:hypothetical protein [bacterium]
MILGKIRYFLTGIILYISAFFLYVDLLFDKYKDHTSILTGTIGKYGFLYLLSGIFFSSVFLYFIFNRSRLSVNKYSFLKCFYLILAMYLYSGTHINSSMFIFICLIFIFHLFSSEKIIAYILFIWGSGLIIRTCYFSELYSFSLFVDYTAKLLVIIFKPIFNLYYIKPFLFFQNGKNIYETSLYVDYIKLLVLPFFYVMFCFSIYFIFNAQIKRLFLFITVSIPVYLITIAGNTFFLSLGDYSFPMKSLYLFRPFIYLAIFIPVFLICYDFKKADTSCSIKPIECSRWHRIFILALIFTVLITVAYKNYYGVKEYNQIEFHINELHSDWENSYIDFLPGLKEPLAENNYSNFVRLLSEYGDVKLIVPGEKFEKARAFAAQEKKINAVETNEYSKYIKKLGLKDVLILKCVTKPFSSEEIQETIMFVKRGGNLVLIGEHTNIFFMNTMINKLSKKFGFTFENDSTVTLEGAWLYSEPEEMIYHPVNYDVTHFMWATNCSINIIHNSVKTIIKSSPASFSEIWEYWNPSFFSSLRRDGKDTCGEKPVMVTRKFGKGKILGFGDSTDFNNYMLYTPGKRELIRGIVRWFSGKYEASGEHILWMVIICLTLAFLCSLLCCRVPVYLIPILIFLSGLAVFSSVNKFNRVRDIPIRLPSERIVFDSFHKPVPVVFSDKHVNVMGKRSYDNFYYELGRLGLPRYLNHGEHLDKVDYNGVLGIILISPKKPYTKKEITCIRSLVAKSGKSLILICGPGKGTRNMNRLSKEFGMNFSKEKFNSKHPFLKNTGHIDGGEPILVKDGICISSWKDFGNGRVLCVGDDLLFTEYTEWFSKKGFEDFIVEFGSAFFKKHNKQKTSRVLNKYFHD